MTGAPSSRAEGALTEWLLRAFALLTYGFFVSRLGLVWWLDSSRWTLLLLLLTEGYTLALLLVARRATARDMAPMTVLASTVAAFYFVLLDAQGTRHLLPEAAGMALQLSGLAWQLLAKVVLGRSFALLPAHRGLVLSGPYRVVRHPIYLGYLVSHLGFLAANFSWRNLAVLGLLYAAQLYRIQREEAVLAQADDYRQYQRRVRWRLIPGLY